MRESRMSRWCPLVGIVIFGGTALAAAAEEPLPSSFRWTLGPPVLGAAPVDGEDSHSVKDPSIVRHDGKWHLFVTVRGTTQSHGIVYLSFADWADAGKAERQVLSNHEGYFCAPQVFYFTPHKKWYL